MLIPHRSVPIAFQHSRPPLECGKPPTLTTATGTDNNNPPQAGGVANNLLELLRVPTSA